MTTTVTSKGQVTIPKHIRDALNLPAGTAIDFAANRDGEVVLQKTTLISQKHDRFESVRGRADIKLRTDELMALLRGES